MTPNIRPVEGKSVWLGSQIDYRQEGMHELSASDVAEIEVALRHLKAQGSVDFAAITPQNFPLPTLGAKLRGLGEELRTGRGFLLLRRAGRPTTSRVSTSASARRSANCCRSPITASCSAT